MNHQIRGVMAASAALCLGALAHAAPAGAGTAAAWMKLPPEVRAHFEAHAKTPPRAALARNGAADVAPPVLQSIDVAATFDAAAPAGQLPVEWRIADDGSGFHDGFAVLTGPTGQVVYDSLWLGAGLRSIQVTAAADTQAFMVPGTWTLTAVYAWDVAGNLAVYDATALQAVAGNHQVAVANRTGGDDVPPTLEKGSIRTPVYSVSSMVPGTTMQAPLVVAVQAKDTGHKVVANPVWVSVGFCSADLSTCFYLGSNTLNQATARATLLATGIPQVPPGDYHLTSLSLGDRASNAVYYTSTTEGGSTDFSQYFDTTTITVTP